MESARSKLSNRKLCGWGFFIIAPVQAGMKSVRKGLREGELERDTYERLRCGECEAVLETVNDPDEIGTVRTCPDCDRQWQELG